MRRAKMRDQNNVCRRSGQLRPVTATHFHAGTERLGHMLEQQVLLLRRANPQLLTSHTVLMCALLRCVRNGECFRYGPPGLPCRLCPTSRRPLHPADNEVCSGKKA